MKKINSFYLLLIAVILTISSCSKEEDIVDGPNNPDIDSSSAVPEFFLSDKMNTPEFLQIANSTQGISIPQDLDFHPKRSNELWVINKGTYNSGGTTVHITNPGQVDQSSFKLKDGNAWHFMALPTSLDFGDNGNWASGTGILDANRRGGKFAGPSLWSGEFDIYAKVGTPYKSGGPNGSHLDMVHQSPYAMGIAHAFDNAYWIFDGNNSNIILYDFGQPHVAGGSDHDDVILKRYTDVQVEKELKLLPSHMVLDKNTGWLYIAETANSRILRFNTKSGSKKGSMNPDPYEIVAEYSEYINGETEVFIDKGILSPVGIEIREDRLFVSDYENGDIIAYNLTDGSEIGRVQTNTKGICGINISAEGQLFYVNMISNEVVQIIAK